MTISIRASSVVAAKAALTVAPRALATQRAAPNQRTCLAVIVALSFPLTTNLPELDLWHGNDGGSIDRCAEAIENGQETEV